MSLLVFFGVYLLGFIILAVILIWFLSMTFSSFIGSGFVPIPKKVLKDILNSTSVTKRILIDLGSGDGRVLREAVRSGFNQAIGYELSPWYFWESRFFNRLAGLKYKAQVLRKNLLSADLTKADVVFIYLFPEIVQKLMVKIETQLKPGAVIISCSYPLDTNLAPSLKLIKKERIFNVTTYFYKKELYDTL
ncbi:MAG: hypothetical protein HYW77_00750 [Parcubacteria group bacterium]|nr:hypothetical protein [Parcubacteria group bacterium]